MKHIQPRRILESIGGNCLTQVVEAPTRNGVFLNLSLKNREGLVGDVKVGGSFGCSGHEIVKFSIEQEAAGQQVNCNFQPFQGWKADFPLVKEDCFREHLGKPDIHKSRGADRMYPQELRWMLKLISYIQYLILNILCFSSIYIASSFSC